MIYFIQEENDGPIKIGRTTGINSRLNSIQCGNPRKLHLLVVIDGGKLEEKALHQRFKVWRIRGEWFVPDIELVQFIDSLEDCEAKSAVTVGFNVSTEHDVALRVLAAERQVDRTTILREAVAAYLAAQGSEALPVIERVVNELALAQITCQEAIATIGVRIFHARLDQRAHDEREWSGVNDDQ